MRPFHLELLLALAGAISAPAASPLRLSVRNTLPIARTQAPVTWSVPLAPEDAILDPAGLRLTLDGVPVPAQFTPMARWGGRPSDTSRPIAWLLVDAQVDLQPSSTLALTLGPGGAALPAGALRIDRNDSSGVQVSTGAASYELSKAAFHLFDRVTLPGGRVFAGSGGLLYQGRAIAPPAAIEPEHVGTERISLRVRGAIDGRLEFTARLHFYRGLAEVKIDFRVENLNPPTLSAEGQPLANDYGSGGSVRLDDLSLAFPGLAPNTYILPAGERGEGGEATGAFSTELSVVQESSGDARWDALRDFAPRLQSGVRRRASTLTIDGVARDGPNRVAGWLDANGVTAAVERAAENFPKALRVRSQRLEVGLFPGEFQRDHEFRAGEFKTHSVWVRHHAAGAPDVGARARSFLAPLRFDVPPEDAARSWAAGLFAPMMTAAFPDYENGTRFQLAESPEWRGEYDARSLPDALSIFQEYGWVDYGDIPTDFEVGTSPYNLKYDVLRGLILQGLRGAGDTWWELAAAGARHAADIDILHSTVRGYASPRRWFEGGMYGHGYHEEDGRTNPHRNAMNPSVSMSGPAAGLLLWAMVSGDTLVLDSARELADNLYWRTVNTDYAGWPGDAAGGQCAVAAGLQTCRDDACSGFEPVDSSRTGGNVVQAMLGAWLATGDSAYLDLVGRIAAYIDCAAAPSCNRFHFQSTFLRSLGHYLLLRRRLRLADDDAARALLSSRADFMTGVLWDAARERFRMCYYDDVVDETLSPINDNWLFSVADAFATAGLALGRPDLIEFYGRKAFEHGARNQFYEGSAISYHSAKEYVNQVGFGQMFLHGYWRLETGLPREPFFADVPASHPYFRYVQLLRQQGITSGCAANAYCPAADIPRGQTATLLIRSMLGAGGYPYPAAPYFSDVPASHAYFQFIQKMRQLGITTGCTATQFCPDASVTRGQTAVFIVRGRQPTPGQSFPFPSRPYFTDVPASHPYFPFI